MKCKWLLQEDVFNEDLESFTKEITKRGMQYEIVKYIPFDIDNQYKVFDDDECVVCYGSINWINRVKHNPWIPGVWLDKKALECTTYYAYYGKYLINKDYNLLSFAEFKRRQKEIFAGRCEVFIRPNSNMKEFAGCAACRDHIELNFRYTDIKPSTLIVISSYKYIETEWRFIIADRKPIAWSRYRTNHHLNLGPYAPQAAINLAEEIAEVEWRPSNVFVIDIGRLKGSNEYGLIEIGSFNCAGLYKCDRSQIVKSISEVALREYDEVYNICCI